MGLGRFVPEFLRPGRKAPGAPPVLATARQGLATAPGWWRGGPWGWLVGVAILLGVLAVPHTKRLRAEVARVFQWRDDMRGIIAETQRERYALGAGTARVPVLVGSLATLGRLAERAEGPAVDSVAALRVTVLGWLQARCLQGDPRLEPIVELATACRTAMQEAAAGRPREGLRAALWRYHLLEWPHLRQRLAAGASRQDWDITLAYLTEARDPGARRLAPAFAAWMDTVVAIERRLREGEGPILARPDTLLAAWATQWRVPPAEGWRWAADTLEVTVPSSGLQAWFYAARDFAPLRGRLRVAGAAGLVLQDGLQRVVVPLGAQGGAPGRGGDSPDR